MSKEAMKLALEALNLIDLEFVCNGAHHAKKDRHELGDDCPVTARYQLAIKALEEALKQEQGEPDKYVMDIECTKCGAKQSGVLTVNTTPQQRKPLTDEQWEEIASLTGCVEITHRGRAAIERVLGIKE